MNFVEFTICNDFERLGRDMVAKCAGLPLAIIVLGGFLATKQTVTEWEIIHRYISSYLIRGEVHERQSRLAEVLDLSYHDLPYQLKPCFLYLSQFPEDPEIPKNKLIQLWVAEGFVSSQYEIERGETMEDIAERYLGSLISRCMVQVGQMGSTGKTKTCRLHDLMRDMCLSKARKEHFLYIIGGGSQQNSSINDESSSNLLDARHSSGVRRLAIFLDQVVDVEKLVLGCPSLCKLHVEGRMERLPEARLFPPQLSKLTLWGCRLVEDPMATLERLPNLKFLSGWEMFVGKKMVCSRNGFPQLKALALRGLPNLEDWVVENQAMPYLYRLSISDCNKLKTVPDGLKLVAGLRELEIRWMPESSIVFFN